MFLCETKPAWLLSKLDKMKSDKVLEYIDFERLVCDVKRHFNKLGSKNRSLSGYSNIATNSIHIDSEKSEIYGYEIRIPFTYTAGLSSGMVSRICKSFHEDIGIEMGTYLKYQMFSSNDANSTNTFLLFNVSDVLRTYGKISQQASFPRIHEAQEYAPIPFLESDDEMSYIPPIVEEDGNQGKIKRKPGCCSIFYCYRTYRNPKCTIKWFMISFVIDLMLLLVMWHLMGWIGLF